MTASFPTPLRLLLFAASLYSSIAVASEDEILCSDLKASAERSNGEMPMWVDFITRADGVAVLCGLRIVEFKHFLNATPAELRDGWQARKQTQWNSMYCADERVRRAINSGWTIADEMTFANGERFRMVAECQGD